MSSKSRPFVCFCVEGKNDIKALSLPITSLFRQKYGDDVIVEFREAEGDITALKGVKPENVDKKIWEHYFKQKDNNSELGWKDLSYLVHIIDIDGVYVKEDDVHFFSEEEEAMSLQLGGCESALYE